VLEQVNGEPADLLIQCSGGERVLQDLEEANALVVSLEAARSCFRYHRLFVGPRSARQHRNVQLRSEKRPPARLRCLIL
jgi:ATP/maltotriose-dependent transcriptional regulator MalT